MPIPISHKDTQLLKIIIMHGHKNDFNTVSLNGIHSFSFLQIKLNEN